MTDKNNVIQRGRIRLEIDTLQHNKIMTEYFVPSDNPNGYGILFLGPDAQYCNNNMYFPIISKLFDIAQRNNIAAMRLEFQPPEKSDNMSHKDYDSLKLNYYVTQASVALDNFKDVIGKHKKILIVGVSGGAYISLEIILRRIEVAGGVLMSPHVYHYPFHDILVNSYADIALVYRPNDINLSTHIMECLNTAIKNHNGTCNLYSMIANDDNYVGHEQDIWNIIVDMLNKPIEHEYYA